MSTNSSIVRPFVHWLLLMWLFTGIWIAVKHWFHVDLIYELGRISWFYFAIKILGHFMGQHEKDPA
jgi:hypothetical protein